jgi:hypothetical protein
MVANVNIERYGEVTLMYLKLHVHSVETPPRKKGRTILLS